MKRFARSPWPWIVVAVLLILFALQYIASPGGYDQIQTSQMDSYITSGQVKQISLVDGGDQTIKATLKPNAARPAATSPRTGSTAPSPSSRTTSSSRSPRATWRSTPSTSASVTRA